jgi:hypothetical protein
MISDRQEVRTRITYCFLVESAAALPKPVVLELAALVPAVVVSTIGATAEESIGVVTVVESTVEGVVRLVESPVVASLSVPLLQAVNAPAIATIANNFFIVD